MKRYEIKLQFRVVQEDIFADPRDEMRVRSAADTVRYMEGAFAENPEQEQMFVLILNTKGQCKGRHLVSLGSQTQTVAHPREIFRAAVLHGATAIVCVHNHPSGDPAPSSADIAVTRQLREAGKLLGIELLDHVVIGEKKQDPAGLGFYSFREAGLL